MNAREFGCFSAGMQQKKPKGGGGEGKTCGYEYLLRFECPTVAPTVKWLD